MRIYFVFGKKIFGNINYRSYFCAENTVYRVDFTIHEKLQIHVVEGIIKFYRSRFAPKAPENRSHFERKNCKSI